MHDVSEEENASRLPGASLLSLPPACRQLLSCVSFGMGNDIKRAFWEERNPILSNATRLRGRQTWGVNDWINTESQPPGREAAECAGPRPPPAGGGAFLTYAAADGNNSRQLTPFFFFFFFAKMEASRQRPEPRRPVASPGHPTAVAA